MPATSSPPPEGETETWAAEVLYRCPKCRLEVGLMLKASVSCSRCGRAMKRVEVGRAS